MRGKWKCQSDQEVLVGDRVAITYGLSSEVIVQILSASDEEDEDDRLSCMVLRGTAIVPAGEVLIVSEEQLLIKVPVSRPIYPYYTGRR